MEFVLTKQIFNPIKEILAVVKFVTNVPCKKLKFLEII